MQTLYDRPDIKAAIDTLDEQQVHIFVGLLSPRQAVVFQGRLRGRPPRRWESLGRAMGISADRVRQLEAEIITKFEAWQRPR
jgi:DNA-directed RNA polymerase sigma subunit (sigma70/sigma32)